MRLAMGLGSDIRDRLTYMKQIGVQGVLQGPPYDPEEGIYEYEALMGMKTQIEEFGMKYEGVSLLPWNMCYKWMLGLPGRDEQIEKLQTTIRNMGKAGVPVLIYNMHALRFYRTSRDTVDRGGARATAFDMDEVKDAPLMTSPGIDESLIPESHRRPITDDEMWDNFEYLLKAIVPVAEESGVYLALHPDDPPVPEIAGVARIMRSPEAFRRAIETVPSDHNGLKFCVGCMSEMGSDVAEEIRYFGSRNKIFFVDFRNVRGEVTCFNETFPDDGKENMFEMMKALYESGYKGAVHPDHALKIDGDTPDSRQYWSFAIGHMRGYLEALGVQA